MPERPESEMLAADILPKSKEERLKDKIEAQFADYLLIIEKGLFPKNIDCVQFWLKHCHRFPIVSQFALNFLSIPATSASVERLFSAAGLSTKGNRHCIGPVLLKAETISKFNRKVLYCGFRDAYFQGKIA